MAAKRVSGYIPKDPKTYIRAGIGAGVAFFVLSTVANRVPQVSKVRNAMFNGV